MKSEIRSAADPRAAVNRFAGGGVARLGDDFTDREIERAEIARSLTTPRGHIVVSGLRRMGKTSLLLAVKEEMETRGEPVVYVDLWSTTTVEDMTTRLSTAAVAAMGQRWQDIVTRLGQRLGFGFEISETSTGLLMPVPKVELRDAPVAEQRKRLVDALDLLEELAKKHKRSLNQEAIHCLEGALSLAGSDRPSLRLSPQPVSVGKILRPLGDRADRQEDFLDRES